MTKHKRKQTPQDHPLWSEFQEYVENGIHFNALPFGQLFQMTKENRDEWMPYWNTFLCGVNRGFNGLREIIVDTFRESFEDRYGKL